MLRALYRLTKKDKEYVENDPTCPDRVGEKDRAIFITLLAELDRILVPIIVDAATGNWYSLDQDRVNAPLEPVKTAH